MWGHCGGGSRAGRTGNRRSRQQLLSRPPPASPVGHFSLPSRDLYLPWRFSFHLFFRWGKLKLNLPTQFPNLPIALEDGKAARGREGGWVVPTRGKYTAWRDWLVPRLSGDTTCKQLFPPLSNSLNHTSKILCQSYFIFWDVFISTTQYKFNWALNVPYARTIWDS